MLRLLAAAVVLSSVALAALACGSEVVADRAGSGGHGGGDSTSTGAGTDASSSAAGGEKAGAPCDDEGSLRCDGEGPGTILECIAGSYAKVGVCEGGEACQNVQGADAVACGALFVGIAGTPCVSATTQVCDLSRQVVLGCDAGTWATFVHCAPGACTDVALDAGQLCSGVSCEGCSYTVGDRCSFPTGSVNCSTDGGQIVGCEAGVVTLFESCAARGLACKRNGSALECG